MESLAEFPNVLHQRIRLRVDAVRGVLHGVTEIYIRPGNQRAISLHARNLQIDEVRVGGSIVKAQLLPRHKQQSADESSEYSVKDFADYMADDYRAALKAERTQGDLAIPLEPQLRAFSPVASKPLIATSSPPRPLAPGGADATTFNSDRAPAPSTGPNTADFAHCSEAFRHKLLHDPLLVSSLKITVIYRKLGGDASVRYLDGLLTTDVQFNRARGLVPCVDLPTSMHSWELQVEAGLCDVAVCSGGLVSQRLLVGCPNEEGEEGAGSEIAERKQNQLRVAGEMEAAKLEKEKEKADAMDVDGLVAIASAEVLTAAGAAAPAAGETGGSQVAGLHSWQDRQGKGPMQIDAAGTGAGVKGSSWDGRGAGEGAKPKAAGDADLADASIAAAQHVPRRPAAKIPNRTPRPYAKVWYYELPLAVAPCHLHVTVGPLAVVPQYQGSTNQLVESFLKQQQQASGGGGIQDSTVITHFGPRCYMELIRSTTRFFYLPFKEYQIASTVNFPLSQLQVIFIPSELAVTPVQVAAGCIVVSTELLHSDTAVEAALEGKMALAEALARQWFGVILQPRSSSDMWLVEGLAGLLADHFFKAWLGQNEVVYRRFKEREAVLRGDDGQPPPLCPQNQYDDADEGVDAAAAGGAGPGVGLGSQSQRRQRKDPLSQMYGSESLDPSPLRRWKAVAVLRMLEKRTGEDNFRSIMQAVCRNAANTIRTWSPSRGPAGRLLSTRRVIAECGSAAGMAKDVAAFAERWVYGRGCPRLTAGCSYVRRSNTLLVALKQEGGPEVVTAGRIASAQRSKSETSNRGVKVAVYDHEGAVQEVVVERMEAHVDAVVHEIEITSKPGQRGRRKRGGGAAAAAAAAAAAGDDGEEEGGGGTQTTAAAAADEHRIPVQYFRVDPGQEWLCDVVVLQSEAMWVAQLRNSKDVVAQSLAVQGLMRLGLQLESSGAADSSSVIGVLLDCVRSTGVYCRVRIEAARALTAFSASMSTQPAAPNLLAFFYDQCRDPITGVLRPNYWADLGTHMVLQAIPACLATIRDVSFNSTPEAMQLVTDILNNNDNSENLYDDSSYLAAVIEAVGLLRPTHASVLTRLLGLLDDYLLRDCLHPSHNYTVGAACLSAMTSLALSVNPRQGRGAGAEAKALELYASVRRQLLRFSRPPCGTVSIGGELTTTDWLPAGSGNTAVLTLPPSPTKDKDPSTLAVASQPPHAQYNHHHRCHDPKHPRRRQQEDEAQPPHHLLRRAAYQCLLRLEAGEAKVMSSRRGAASGGTEGKPASRVVALALRLLHSEPMPALQLAVMMEMLTLLGTMQARVLEEAREDGNLSEPGALTVPVSSAVTASLYKLALRDGEEPRVRHAAFMSLQLLTSQPPSLFRTSPEDALAAEEAIPEPSNITGRPPRSHATGMPPNAAAAAAGCAAPARSVGTAGQLDGMAGTAAAIAPAPKRIKISTLRPGASVGVGAGAAAPSASTGGVVSGAEGSVAPAGPGAMGQGIQPGATEATRKSSAQSPPSMAPSQPLSQGPAADASTAATVVQSPPGIRTEGGPSPTATGVPVEAPLIGATSPEAAAAAAASGAAKATPMQAAAAARPVTSASTDAPRRKAPVFGTSPLRRVAHSPSPPPRPGPASTSTSPRSGANGATVAGVPQRSPPRDPRLGHASQPNLARGRSISPTEMRPGGGVPKPKPRPAPGSALPTASGRSPSTSTSPKRQLSGPSPPRPPRPTVGFSKDSTSLTGAAAARGMKGLAAAATAAKAASPTQSRASPPSPRAKRPPQPQPSRPSSRGLSPLRGAEVDGGPLVATARAPSAARPSPARAQVGTTVPATAAVPSTKPGPTTSPPREGAPPAAAAPTRKW
ncbi:hypothetical protein VaNZ11_004324, partial [Volvox africanus]